ncbi:MAG: endonuclease/exonuclease/phosphatase family protein, partial [Halieaceae bacterium]|nr:endonuclease/exonuclease/phosphatase family protein [Halieaceae bacterium]
MSAIILLRLSLPLLPVALLAATGPLMAAGDTQARVLRVATFNVSMEGGNYVDKGVTPNGHELPAALGNSDHPQISNIAEIIQRVRPDILLLNEFDYHPDPARGV